jgi:myosin III
MKDGLNVSTLPSPLDRYTLANKLGSGIFGKVFKATDGQAAGKSVAVKVQTYTDDTEVHIQEEYKILRDFTKHPNLIDFYGVFCEKSEGVKKIWFVLEVSNCNTKDNNYFILIFVNRITKLGIVYIIKNNVLILAQFLNTN